MTFVPLNLNISGHLGPVSEAWPLCTSLCRPRMLGTSRRLKLDRGEVCLSSESRMHEM
jgi:hypothetical protein